jgi:RNA polymerase sigma-70 factor (ECF subfamily)
MSATVGYSSGACLASWSIVHVFHGRATLASDADLIGGIALSRSFDLLPARRTEEREMQGALQSTFHSVSATAADSDLSDEGLIALLRVQDPQALDILFSRHSRLVYSIALRILHDAGEAEEVVQECFLYVYRRAGAFEPSRGSGKVWIVQVAYSRARDRKAHLARRGFYIRTDIESLELEDTLAGRENVENEIGARLDLSSLQCAFDDLTELQRETLKLYYFEDMGLREISQQLNEPLGNVRHHFYRGLERLRRSALVERLRNHHNGKN